MTIKQVRSKYNLTQKQVGDLIGVSESAVCRMENGEYGLKVEHAKKIAAALGFDWTRFFEKDEDGEEG